MSYERGLFDQNLFEGFGDVPPNAAPISAIEVYRSRFSGLPTQAQFAQGVGVLPGGVTHFTTRVLSGTTQEFMFYNAGGVMFYTLAVNSSGGRTVVGGPGQPPSPPSPPATKEEGAQVAPAYEQGDGLLPTPASTSRPEWVPYAMLGGAVVVGGGILWFMTRSKKVAPNRRRRVSRRRR